MAFGLVFIAGAGRDAEEAGLRVDRVQAAVVAEAHPGDVVADGLDLPARDAWARAWRGWSCRRRCGNAAARWLTCPSGPVSLRISMCSASQPSSRAIAEAMRSAKHFLPSSALPP